MNSNNNYNNLPEEDKIGLGIMFVLSGVTLPEALRTFFVQNNLYENLKAVGEVSERY